MPEGMARGLGWAALEPRRVRPSVGILAAVVLAHAATGAAVVQRLGASEPPHPLVISARLIESPIGEPVGEQPAAPAEPPAPPPEPSPPAEPPPAPLSVAEPPKAKAPTPVPERPKSRPKPKPKPKPPRTHPPEPSPSMPEPSGRDTPSPRPIPAASAAGARAGTPGHQPSGAASGPTAPPGYRAGYLSNPAPAYPEEARRRGEEGRVLLRVQVSAAGVPTGVQIAASSGSALLDRAAASAVARWRFVPARRGGQSVAAAVLVPLSFSLRR